MPGPVIVPLGKGSEISEGVYTLFDTNKKVVAVVGVREVDGTGFPFNRREYWDVVQNDGADQTHYKNFQVKATADKDETTLTWVFKPGWDPAWDRRPVFPFPHYKWDAGTNAYVGANASGIAFYRWVHATFRAIDAFTAP